jgi:hypothetical protein
MRTITMTVTLTDPEECDEENNGQIAAEITEISSEGIGKHNVNNICDKVSAAICSAYLTAHHAQITYHRRQKPIQYKH